MSTIREDANAAWKLTQQRLAQAEAARKAANAAEAARKAAQQQQNGGAR